MRRLRNLWFRLDALLHPRRMESELDQELQFHLDMEAEKLVGQGAPPEEAVREARRRFDGLTRPRQEVRDSWGIGWVRDFLVDVRQAGRQFRRRPGFSALGILTLALGLGATVGLFGVVRSILLRPLPVANESSLRVFWLDYSWRGVELDYLKERTRAFSKLAAYAAGAATLRRDAGSTVVTVGIGSAELFDVLGVRPLRGRTFVAGEDRPGAEPVAVLGYGTWQQELGGDPDVIGRRIVLDGRSTTVIGVMPRGFYFPTPDFQIWIPLDLDPASGDYQENNWLTVLGRLRSGVGAEQERQEVAALAAALGQRFTYPAAWDKTKGAFVLSLRQYLVGDVKPALLLLFGAGGLLLLMACANVAALVLARTTDRSQEITLRAALGAGRGRLARQIVAEALTFSTAAGLLGSAVAAFGFDLLFVRSLPLRNGMATTVSLDWPVFLVALLLAAVVGLLVAAAPVRDLLRGQLTGVSGARTSPGLARGTGRVHSLLVGSEAAVAVLLVVGAFLLIRSVSRLLAVDLGFEPAGIVAVDVVASGSEHGRAERMLMFREIEERAAAIPGVSAAGYVGRLPVRDPGWQGLVEVVGRPDLEGGTAPNALFRAVSPGYFQALGIGLLAGRGIEEGDRLGTTRIGVVSESFARRAWPDESALGRLVRTQAGGDTSAIMIVGVADEIRSESLTGRNQHVLYVADAQRTHPTVFRTLVLRTTGSGASVLGAVQRIVADVNPGLATFRPTTMEAVVEGAMAEPVQLRFFLSLFAGLALVLGLVGIYSVVSYSVVRRQSELGIRMALGATPRQVLRQVIRRGLAPVVMGTGIGVLVAVVLARAASRFLYEVSPADPVSVAGAAAALLLAGVAAAAVPAVRASRVSPVESLRAD